MVMQRKPLIIAMLFLGGLLMPLISKAQVVCSTEYKGDADVKVYVTEYKGAAALVVYKTEYQGDAEDNKGIWYFTEYKGAAKKKIYFTDYKGDADLVVYFTEYKGAAGWQNKKKERLMD